jgi:hypothetical protein
MTSVNLAAFIIIAVEDVGDISAAGEVSSSQNLQPFTAPMNVVCLAL